MLYLREDETNTKKPQGNERCGFEARSTKISKRFKRRKTLY
jgi:hypothetical protein